MMDDDECGALDGMIDRETEVLAENLPHCRYLSTINPTLPDLGSSQCRCGGKPATNRLSYVTAIV
jgi:hypothetical protein